MRSWSAACWVHTYLLGRTSLEEPRSKCPSSCMEMPAMALRQGLKEGYLGKPGQVYKAAKSSCSSIRPPKLLIVNAVFLFYGGTRSQRSAKSRRVFCGSVRAPDDRTNCGEAEIVGAASILSRSCRDSFYHGMMSRHSGLYGTICDAGVYCDYDCDREGECDDTPGCIEGPSNYTVIHPLETETRANQVKACQECESRLRCAVTGLAGWLVGLAGRQASSSTIHQTPER
ncbi:hypothetical protein B0T24DRAFT_160225 [Lasiosphaeria ovina]|uniref:Uncharacterized protein n=1 Tax=Lasiosphaeria ovina TaxID=92902 RepID=A0AAE0NDL5_9PEZI|nr:hypothetical protein B0T24DRAFT_160225 [Lasiosphaeria ovina]